jgi:hypothetical protein
VCKIYEQRKRKLQSKVTDMGMFCVLMRLGMGRVIDPRLGKVVKLVIASQPKGALSKASWLMKDVQ